MDPIKLYYSESFIRETVRTYWWKQVGLKFLSAVIFMSIFWLYQIAGGDRSWLVGVEGAVLFIATGLMIATYFVHLKRALDRLRRMNVPEGMLEIGDRRFKIASDVGSTEIEWSLIKQIWRFEKAWLLFFSAGEFMTLPVKDIPPDVTELILKRAKENGAKIA